MFLLIGATNLSVLTVAETDKQSLYNAELRQQIGLDYSMSDYTLDKIDEKIIASRSAAILTKLNETYFQRGNLELLNMIQTRQIDGLSYARIKELKFDEVKN